MQHLNPRSEQACLLPCFKFQADSTFFLHFHCFDVRNHESRTKQLQVKATLSSLPCSRNLMGAFYLASKLDLHFINGHLHESCARLCQLGAFSTSECPFFDSRFQTERVFNLECLLVPRFVRLCSVSSCSLPGEQLACCDGGGMLASAPVRRLHEQSRKA